MKKLLILSLLSLTALPFSACSNDAAAPVKPCIPRCDGDTAINCVANGNTETATQTQCDPGLCKYDGKTMTAACLEKCPTEKEADFSCDADGNVRFMGCLQSKAGAWYLSSSKVEQECKHGCEDGKCIKLVPEEGMPCDPASTGSECRGKYILNCVDGFVAVSECPDDNICINRAGQILCRQPCDKESSSDLCIDADHSQSITCSHDKNNVLYYEDVTVTCAEGCDYKTSKCHKNLPKDGTICNPEKVSNTCVNDILSICDKESGYYTSRDCAKFGQRCVAVQKDGVDDALCADYCDTPDATRLICDGDASILQTCTVFDNGSKIWKNTTKTPCENGCHTVTGECKGPSGCKENDPSFCNGDTMHGCIYDEETQTWQKGSVNCLIEQNLCYSGITTGYCLPMPLLDPTPANQPSEKGASCNPMKFVEHCDGNTLVYCFRGKDDPGYVVYRTDCSEENEVCGITRFFDEDNPEGVNQGQCLNNINLCDDPHNPVTIECFGKTAYSVKCQTYTDKKLHTVAQRAKQTCTHACVDGLGCVDEEN